MRRLMSPQYRSSSSPVSSSAASSEALTGWGSLPKGMAKASARLWALSVLMTRVR